MGLGSFVFLITMVLVLCKPVDINNVKSEKMAAFATEEKTLEAVNVTKKFRNDAVFMNQIRPGMTVTDYKVAIEADVDAIKFSGTAEITVAITDFDTREDPVLFYVDELTINSVMFSILGGSNTHDADFSINDDDFLEIDPGIPAISYTFTIEYTGSLEKAGKGLYVGHYGDK